jgi:Ca2+-binding EF-hand superfamily protein
VGEAGKGIRVQGQGRGHGPFRLELPGAIVTVLDGGETGTARLRAASRFTLAQFKTILGERPAVEKRDLEEDPAAGVLADLFDAADRNGDGKLTLAELEAFLALLEQGVSSQVVLTVTDRGRNLFDALDADGDGRLDLQELGRAGRLLPDGGAASVSRDTLPVQVRLGLRRGTPGKSFGPLPLADGTRPPGVAGPPRGPAWFRAMDRNGDGFVSPREFLGPPDLFRRLDLDGDGLISVDEAERSEASGVRPGRLGVPPR